MKLNAPSLDELRSHRYVKRAMNNSTGITHGRRWEQTTVIHNRNCGGACGESCVQNRQHTLRISQDFAEALERMRGPKGRRSSRVPGPTPDESYVQAGQRANGLPHQLRRRMCLLFAMSDEAIQNLLERYPEGKPKRDGTSPLSKKRAVGLVMPSLVHAIDELYHRLLKSNPDLGHHPLLQRRWAPAVCRLIEIHHFHQQQK